MIPDLQISLTVPELDLEPETLWLVECAFIQTREQVMRKFERYIADFLDICALVLVNVTECLEYRSPVMKSTTCRTLSHLFPIRSYREWTPGNWKDTPMGLIITYGHTWVSLSGVEIEV
jgi:hypothetical protein